MRAPAVIDASNRVGPEIGSAPAAVLTIDNAVFGLGHTR
jgi:hypothetical protein